MSASRLPAHRNGQALGHQTGRSERLGVPTLRGTRRQPSRMAKRHVRLSRPHCPGVHRRRRLPREPSACTPGVQHEEGEPRLDSWWDWWDCAVSNACDENVNVVFGFVEFCIDYTNAGAEVVDAFL